MPILERQVSASTDDCWATNGGIFDLTQEMVVGYHDASDNRGLGVGNRFLNITIPPGSIITAAYLRVRARDTRTATVVNTKIRGEKSLNPNTFSTYNDFFARPRTTNFVYWDNVPPFTGGNWYNSPDISAVIQEIINQPGWASGNAIVIFWDDFDERSTHGSLIIRYLSLYDQDPSYAAILHIEYTPPPAGRSYGYIF
jgi:hypothetical protein